MKKFFNKASYLSKCMCLYLVINVILIALSLIFLIWNNYYLSTSLAIGFICGLVNLVLLIVSSSNLNTDKKTNSSMLFIGGFFIRFLIMFLAVGLSFLVIYLTKPAKYDYFYLLASGVPFIISTFVISCVKDENKGEE